MKKFYSLLAALAVSAVSFAQKISVDDVAIKAGEPAEVSVNVTGATIAKGFGAIVEIPAEVSFVYDADEEVYCYDGDVFAKNHSISDKLQSETTLKLAIVDLKKNAQFKEDEGTMFSFKITTSAANGTYAAKIKSIEFSDATNTLIKQDDVNFNIVVCDDPTAINGVNANSSVKAVYNAAGAQQNGLQKGINIVKMADGSVKKIAK